MKNKILISIAFILLISFMSLASAGEVTQLNNFRQAVINTDGSITYTSDPIDNVNAIGFICPDQNCTSITSKIFENNSGSNSFMTLIYPTSDSIQHYGTYFYKSGWIGYEVNSSGKGTGTAPDLTVYLAKKQQCYSPITNLEVLNQVEPNMPLFVNVTTGIDANAYAAILNSGPLEYDPPELSSYRKINTSITLFIKNESGNIIYSETKYRLISYSGYKNVNFTYVFQKKGKYKIEVTTNVVDEKCLSTLPLTASANTQVIYQNETNYSYSLIQNLSMDPVYPLVNQSVNFSFNYLSNYVNSTGDLIPVKTSIYVNITKNGSLVSKDYFLLNPIDTDTFNIFSFIKSFSSPGTYFLTVRGVPNSTFSSSKTIDMSQTLEFIVAGLPEQPKLISIKILRPLNNEIFNTSIVPLQYVINGTAESCFYSLDNNTNLTITGCQNTSINAQNGSHLLVLYAKNGNILVRDSVNFKVLLSIQNDTTPPIITIYSPASQTYKTKNISINLSINEPGLCIYNLNNNANKTLSQSGNYFTGNENNLADGSYSFNAFCTDLNGNKASKSVNFIINTSTGGGGGGGGGGGESEEGGSVTHHPQFISGLNETIEEGKNITIPLDYNDGPSPMPETKTKPVWIWLLISLLVLLIMISLLIILLYRNNK